jgi:predicted DNA binding CopG/RHH family protein
MSMSDRDDAAAAYYELAENQEPAGPGRKRSMQSRRLTTHVPIRFSSAVIERVKELAAEDGKTVSSWIRDVIEREVLLREQSRTVGVVPRLEWRRRPTPIVTSGTVASSAEDLDDLRELVS